MHFEILVEDASGKALLDTIVPKIIDTTVHSFDVKSYKGLGHLPPDLHTRQDPSKRILLEQLPRLLRGYGKRFQHYAEGVVIVVVDCDKRSCKEFKQELVCVLESCNPKPSAYFRIAIEEMEAWLLGDKNALEKAYPKYDSHEYDSYEQDSIIGTWEKLAVITLAPNAAKTLLKAAYSEIGKQKSEWARNIGQYMDVQNNASPSFNCFKRKLEDCCDTASGAAPC